MLRGVSRAASAVFGLSVLSPGGCPRGKRTCCSAPSNQHGSFRRYCATVYIIASSNMSIDSAGFTVTYATLFHVEKACEMGQGGGRMGWAWSLSAE